MPSSKINKKIEVIATTAAASKPRLTHRHRDLHAIADRISHDADAMSIASAVSEIYLSALQRIFHIGTALDRAQQLQSAHAPGWKQSMRAARFACKDEMEYLRLVDLACRGLCDCLGLRTRISFETIAKINAHKYQDPSEELRRHDPRDLLIIMIFQKSIMFNWRVPEELLFDGSEDELRAYLDRTFKDSRALIGVIGQRTRVHEVMHGKRPLSLNMIRNLHEEFDIPAEVLIQPARRRRKVDVHRSSGRLRRASIRKPA
jgi:hypothetical protein